MSDIDELINRAKTLIQSQKKPTRKSRNENDIFIYQNRPVHTTDWSTERDVTFIGIYLPSKLPVLGIPYTSIVLHKHTVFESCDRNRYCHIYGWDVPDIHLRSFNHIWGYLYNPTTQPTIKLGKVDFSL